MRKYPMKPRKPYRARNGQPKRKLKLEKLSAPYVMITGLCLGVAVGVGLLVCYRYQTDIRQFATRVSDCHVWPRLRIRTLIRLSECLDRN